jgi:mannose-1-phosphate guanylyltransferase
MHPDNSQNTIGNAGSSTAQPEDSSHRHLCLDLPGLWSVVLAGGEGTRIRPFIQSWLGRHRPKQYCAFVGTRSLLQHTLDRAARLAPDERTLVVIDRSHRQFAEPQLAGRPSIRLILQPCNRDTAPGIFLPLTYVRQMDAEATAIVYPSDHFVYPEHQYNETVRAAVEEAACHPDRLILLGVTPDSLELEYGWIQPGTGNGSRVMSVKTFVEKPGVAEARAIMEAGALWNTFVLVSRVKLLWQLGWLFFPEMMPLFETLGSVIGTDDEADALNSIYSEMPARNFSSDLLQRAPQHVGVVKLDGVLWSDWGRPERIIESLRKIDREPAFQSPELEEAQATA